MSRPNTPALAVAIATALAGSALLTAPGLAAADIVAKSTKVINGATFTFLKSVNEKGQLAAQVFDGKGRLISESAVPRGVAPLLDGALQKRLANLRAGETVAVDIALNLPTPTPDLKPESGEAEVLNGLTVRGAIDGKELSEKGLAEQAKVHALEQGRLRAELQEARAKALLDWARTHGLSGHKEIEEALGHGHESVTLKLDGETIKKLAGSKDPRLAGLELHSPGEDDINQAMADTSISTSALPYSTTRGDNIGIYMTESGCANESRFNEYDRLSGSETNHSRNVGAIIKTVAPESFMYCRGSAVLPQFSDLDGVGGNPPIHIVTRSNSTNDNTNFTTLDRDWDNFVYNYNIPVFNSGGNTGGGTGNVRSPGKGLNVVTVGNYNDANDTISGSSPFNDPQTGNDKPEVSAPGTNISAGGFTMSGTSQSTPHAAAFSADMMSHSTYLQYRPYLLKAKLLAGATDPISGGYGKVGLGGIDFRSAQWSGYWAWYSGNNSSFGYFDTQDGNSDGYVEKRIYISSSWDKVRVVLSWLNRGSYTYSHRNDAHPIGMDLDLRVYNPSGNYVGGSFSWDNPFERVEFTPTVSGYYTFKINRYANRDTSSRLGMGLYVNYYNQ